MVLFNVYSGITVSKIGIPGLIDIEFNSENSTSSEAGPKGEGQGQDQDQTRSTDRIDRGGTIAGPAISDDENMRDVSNNTDRKTFDEDIYRSVQPQTPVVDPNGTWYGADGYEYNISYNGSTVYFTEYGLFGATVNGTGTYQNNTILFEYETVFGTVGTATLNISANGYILIGRAIDRVAGTSTELYLMRY